MLAGLTGPHSRGGVGGLGEVPVGTTRSSMGRSTRPHRPPSALVCSKLGECLLAGMEALPNIFEGLGGAEPLPSACSNGGGALSCLVQP